MKTDTGNYPIREAFRKFFPAYLAEHPMLPEEKCKAGYAIMRCKSGDLGYNISICEDCGHPLIHAVSCNNRNCPCCQLPQERKWELERNSELIEGIAYYHVVFTLPEELNHLILTNQKVLLKLLFTCATETLLSLCADRKFMGAKPGIISVLHTWGQKLNFHPHLHVCMSGGGITPAGQFVNTCHKGFFLPEAVVASSFRGRFLVQMKSLYNAGRLNLSQTPELEDPEEWQAFINRLFKKRWLPFIKETFNGKGNAIKYLARYSFRTAIANSRIISVTDKTVTFSYKDYADNNAVKTMTVPGKEFIGMFLTHVLPSGFHRMRLSGYLASCCKTKNLKLIHRLRSSVYPGNPYRHMNMQQLMLELFGVDICQCQKCNGHMIPLARAKPREEVSEAIDCAFMRVQLGYSPDHKF